MSQYLRIESETRVSFCTSKTQNNLLWFVNNPLLEEDVLGYLAKHVQKYSIKLYAFVMQGNHYHLTASFPLMNRSDFFRDFNSRFAHLTKKHVKEFPGGHLFKKRYSEQALPLPIDLEDRFFYCALQPVNAGLCQYHHEYPGYNSYDDAISGKVRKCRVISWDGFNHKKRYKPDANIEDFTTYYDLSYLRLPEYEDLTIEHYSHKMNERLELERQSIIAEREIDGKTSFMGREALLEVLPGTSPVESKESSRENPCPIVLSRCPDASLNVKEEYFATKEMHRAASIKYRAGDSTAIFPLGTYKPPGPLVRT